MKPPTSCAHGVGGKQTETGAILASTTASSIGEQRVRVVLSLAWTVGTETTLLIGGNMPRGERSIWRLLSGPAALTGRSLPT